LQGEKRIGSRVLATQALLSIHVRILLQSLRYGHFFSITRFKLLYPDWRGYLISFFALVWVANVYMGIFANLRLDISHERIEIKSKDLDLQ